MEKKLLVIVGPTASGKSKLAVFLAKKFNGEVVSADSRQVYKYLDIGSGKITKKEMEGIPHHLLDVANPKRKFTVAQYQKLAQKAIEKIMEKKKLPILCGGSGFYIKAVIEGLQIPKVPPDWKFRKKLEKKSAKELYEKLKKLDPERAKTIDPKNKRRLIRALEIIKKLKKVPKLKKIPPPYKILIIGIKKSKKQLKILIKKRLKKRLKKGLIAEVKKLRKYGLSFKRLKEFGLEYKWVALYLEKKISYQEMVKNLLKDIERFAKKQISFFKKLKGVKWVKNYKEAQNLVRRFLLS